MAIYYNEEEKIFHLQTPKTSYVMSVFQGRDLLHLYYGKRIRNYVNTVVNMPVNDEVALTGNDVPGTKYSTDVLPMEYPCYGSADMRMPAFQAEYKSGNSITCFEYLGFRIFKGKKPLCGLPSTYVENESESDTLEITLCDRLTGVEAVLSYTSFNNIDAIAKSVIIRNNGSESIRIKNVLSSTIYLFDKDYDFVHLEGAWARERSIQKEHLINGLIGIDSKRVSSGHQHSPFLALARTNTDETQGEVYAMSLVYSGNHIALAETDPQNTVRVSMGINTFDFSWELESQKEFQAPEVVLTYSDSGYGEMSKTYHKLYRTRLCRGKYRDKERPVLINNWEATYFDFNEQKILNIAKIAKNIGIELMVLDDGWFGKRNNDHSSLGDWVANKSKLPNGVEGLANSINDIGMKFGLWFEPEMVSPDSDLYRAHPDWCIHVDGRNRTLCRNQLVLDLSRTEVCDYIVSAVSAILSSAPISYVKWDMNRNITELNSSEQAHRYMLGLYGVLGRITTAFPDVLFEGCASGGGRFDAGMLAYFPQYWTSDNTDAIERLYIQYGTSMVMPSSTMGAHVSAVPNHQMGRITPLATRGHVAMMGQFGYELDLEALTEKEINEIKEQIKTYKTIREVIHKGNMYRLLSPFNGTNAAWEYVSDDKSRVIIVYISIMVRNQTGKVRIQLRGLDGDAIYVDRGIGIRYGGDQLMNVGLYFECKKDFESKMIIFDRL